MIHCESDRGEWGGICPDCGQRLPPRPGPMTTWMAEKYGNPEQTRNARAAIAAGRVPRMRLRLRRKAA